MQDDEVVDVIRNLLGGLTVEDMPNSMLNFFWLKWKNYYNVQDKPKMFSLAVYNTVVDCVRWLIAQEVSSGSSSVTERLEKIGDETISIKGGSTLQSWKDFLDWLELNPDYIDPSLNASKSLVIIGGVRKDEFSRVKRNPNSYDGFMEEGIYPSPRDPSQRRLNPKKRNPWTLS